MARLARQDVADLEDLAEEAAPAADADADGDDDVEEGYQGRYISFAGGGSVSDLAAVVSEMNRDAAGDLAQAPPGLHRRPVPRSTTAGGAGPSSLGLLPPKAET